MSTTGDSSDDITAATSSMSISSPRGPLPDPLHLPVSDDESREYSTEPEEEPEEEPMEEEEEPEEDPEEDTEENHSDRPTSDHSSSDELLSIQNSTSVRLPLVDPYVAARPRARATHPFTLWAARRRAIRLGKRPATRQTVRHPPLKRFRVTPGASGSYVPAPEPLPRVPLYPSEVEMLRDDIREVVDSVTVVRTTVSGLETRARQLEDASDVSDMRIDDIWGRLGSLTKQVVKVDTRTEDEEEERKEYQTRVQDVEDAVQVMEWTVANLPPPVPAGPVSPTQVMMCMAACMIMSSAAFAISVYSFFYRHT